MAGKLGDLIMRLTVDDKDMKDKLSGLDKGIKDIGGQIEASMAKGTTAIGSMQETLGNAGKTLSSLGGTLTKTLTLPIAGLLGASFKFAADFEQSFADVIKTVDATQPELAKLRRELLDMSTVMPIAATELAQVASIAGQLGIATPNISKFTEVMANMAVATNLSSEAAATSIARIFNIMGTGASEYENFASAVVHLGNTMATTESEIVNITLRMAGAAANAKMSEADLLAMAASMSAVGLTAEAGGTAMGKFITTTSMGLTLGAKNTEELLKLTGMSARDLELMASNAGKEFKGIAESVNLTTTELNRMIKISRDGEKYTALMAAGWDSIVKAWDNGSESGLQLSKVTQDLIGSNGEFTGTVADWAEIMENDAGPAQAMILAGMEAMGWEGETVNEILQDLGITEQRQSMALRNLTGDSDKFVESLISSNKAYAEASALQEEVAKKNETFQSQWQMLKNTFVEVGIELGTQMLPYMKQLVEWLKGLADHLRDLSPEQWEKIVKQFVALAAVGPALSIVGKALSGISSTMKIMSSLKTGLGGLTQLAGKDKLLSGIDAEGGWTKEAFDATGMTGNNYKVPQLPAGGFANRKNIEDVKDYVREIKTINPAMVSAGDIATSVAKTPWFKGAVITTLIARTVQLTVTNDKFRDGLKVILSPLIKMGELVVGMSVAMFDWGKSLLSVGGPLELVGNLLSDVSKFFGLDIGDLGMAALGIALLAVNAPLAGLVLGFEAVSLAVRGVGSLFQSYNESITLLGGLSEETRERIEPLTDALGEMSQQLTEAKFGEILTPEDVESFSANANMILDTLRDDYVTGIEEQKARVLSGELFNYLDEEERQKIIDGLDENKSNYETKLNETQEKINEIMVRTNENGGVLRKEDIADLERYLFEMQELTITQMTASEAEQLMLKERYKKLSGDLKSEEYDEYERKAKENAESTRIALAEQFDEEEKLLRMHFSNENGELTTDGLKKLALAEKNYKDKLKATDDGEKDLLAAVAEARNKLEVDEQRKYLKSLTNNEEHHKAIDKATKTGLKNLINTVKNRNIEMNTEGEALGKALELGLGRGVEGLGKQGEGAGADYVAGVDRGVRNNSGNPMSAAADMASGMLRRFQSILQIKSPSRVMMEMGGYVTEGTAIGINRGAGEAVSAMEKMASDMVEAYDLSEMAEAETNVTQNLNKKLSYEASLGSGESRIADTIARAIANQLQDTKLTAVIGEEAFHEEVEDVVRRNLR